MVMAEGPDWVILMANVRDDAHEEAREGALAKCRGRSRSYA